MVDLKEILVEAIKDNKDYELVENLLHIGAIPTFVAYYEAALLADKDILPLLINFDRKRALEILYNNVDTKTNQNILHAVALGGNNELFKFVDHFLCANLENRNKLYSQKNNDGLTPIGLALATNNEKLCLYIMKANRSNINNH